MFVGMVYFVVLTGISGKLLDTDFYTAVLNDSDSYDRLYEVAAEEILKQSESSLVGIYMPDEEELSDLLRQIAPPSYVRSQAESNIELTLLYLNGDADGVDPRIEMQEPLERVRPVLIDYIPRAHRRAGGSEYRARGMFRRRGPRVCRGLPPALPGTRQRRCAHYRSFPYVPGWPMPPGGF